MEGRRIVGWNVRKLRVAKGFSIEELAGRAGLGDSFVSKLERGEVNASVDNLELLARALRCELAELFVRPKPGEKPPSPLKAGRRPKG
jgi:transcriptional regulator with XRE-family HTH domain